MITTMMMVRTHFSQSWIGITVLLLLNLGISIFLNRLFIDISKLAISELKMGVKNRAEF